MKYFVTMRDTFLSGWGAAKGKTNILQIECDTREQADLLAKNAERREEMRTIKVTAGKPPYYPTARYLVTHKVFGDFSGPWLEK